MGGGDLSSTWRGQERRGSCRTDYYNVGIRVLREFLDLCAGNDTSSVSLSICLPVSPQVPPSVPVDRTQSGRSRIGERANAQRTSSKLHILLSPGGCWEYLRMPEGRAAEACRVAGADGQTARGAALRRRDLELATPVR